MLKIKHPAAIVREREKKISNWETVRSYRYANGVECQILIGFLPHGHAQSVISANRDFTLARDGENLDLSFGDEPRTMLDFLTGDRPTEESDHLQVLDPCMFIPSARVKVSHEGGMGELKEDGANTVATFADGTTVALQPHGGHAHVEAKRDGKVVTTFYNGKDDTLYVFGLAEHLLPQE